MAMKGFTEKIVNLMKSENMFESQGGPIILSQVCALLYFGYVTNFFSFKHISLVINALHKLSLMNN